MDKWNIEMNLDSFKVSAKSVQRAFQPSRFSLVSDGLSAVENHQIVSGKNCPVNSLWAPAETESAS
jgi:hypothetical protein